MVNALRRIVRGESGLASDVFEWFIQLTIILSLVGLTIQTLPGINARFSRVLGAVKVATLAVFSVEYLLRILSAGKPARYIFSFWGIIDFLAIAPNLLFPAANTQFIRTLRLLRLLRVLKLGRNLKALERLEDAFIKVRSELTVFSFLSLIILFLASAGIYSFEHDAQPDTFESIPHSLWWAIVTLTTVGYGDAYPVTIGGKAFASLIMFLGFGIVAVPTGLIASVLANDVRDSES